MWEINSHYSYISLFSEHLQSPSESHLTTLNCLHDLDWLMSLLVYVGLLQCISNLFNIHLKPLLHHILISIHSLKLTGAYFFVYVHYLTTLHTLDTYFPWASSYILFITSTFRLIFLAFLAVLMALVSIEKLSFMFNTCTVFSFYICSRKIHFLTFIFFEWAKFIILF